MKVDNSKEHLSSEFRDLLLKGEKDLERALKLINLLSNPTRLKMAYLLCNKELCTNDLERILNVEQTLISHHLRAFKDLKLTKERREGRWRFYSIKDKKILDLFRAVKIPVIE
jgi:DNA-binding transcriptional ArsR family regulator